MCMLTALLHPDLVLLWHGHVYSAKLKLSGSSGMLVTSVQPVCHWNKNVSFLACLYESTESYHSHFDVGIGIGVTF